MFYTNDDIQIMLNQTIKNPDLKERIRSHFKGDLPALNDVLSDGYVDRFDRYDSDVCEQFISAYLAETKED